MNLADRSDAENRDGAPLPQWEKLPFAARWEELQKYGGSLRHTAHQIQRLMQMPFNQIFEPYLQTLSKKNAAIMRRNLVDIMEEFEGYAGDLPDTFLQAVETWLRMCQSREIDWREVLGEEEGARVDLKAIEESALTLTWDLLFAFLLVYRTRSPKKSRSDKAGAPAGSEQQQPPEGGEPEAPADTESRAESPHRQHFGRLPLEQRLHMAGVCAQACPSMPLAGVGVRRVFEAADALAGAEYCTRSLQKRPCADPAYAGLPDESTVKQMDALLGGVWAEYAWEFPALFGIDDPRSALGPPELTYDGMLANIYEALQANTYGLFEERGSGLSPYGLLYKLLAEPLLSVAAAQGRDIDW